MRFDNDDSDRETLHDVERRLVERNFRVEALVAFGDTTERVQFIASLDLGENSDGLNGSTPLAGE